MSKNDGGPAFPGWMLDNAKEASFKEGMSLRDLFALGAVVGMHANPACNLRRDQLVVESFLTADAMLEARK